MARQIGELPRVTRGEIAGLLQMVIARLQADPSTVEEWIIIEKALRKAAGTAGSYRACFAERNGIAQGSKST